ncbi:MAG: T9SS type A sorting domain-containing protein, partial [candidate division Zixibacteria bacterium]|nr:T9SS type A sorting domain-containing protein [candidate division Zixibacteria bacterium]
PEMIKQILMDTAYDLGDPGNDNDYGYGIIDCYEAVLLALSYLEGYGVIMGQVTDAFTGDGLPGTVTVTNHDPEIIAHCNNDGHYSLYVPADSAWDLRAEYTDDYQPAYATVTVAEDDTVYQDFALLPPDFEITMEPDDPPIYVHPGEHFTYTGTLTNQTDQNLTTDVWIMLEAPEYGTVGPLKRYNNVPIAAGETISVSNIRQNIPMIAPIGQYEYISYCGDYPDIIEDQYSFDFVVWPEGGALAEVVILCADYTDDWHQVRDMLLEDPNVLSVDFIDVRETTPQLTDLIPYNVALVWSNYTFANTDALGDVLADFTDVGGGVVTCEFAHYGGWALGGRYMTDYSPLGVGSSGYQDTDMIVDDPNHPIMLGVTSGSEYFNYNAPFTAPNYTMVCHWDNGYNGTTFNADHPRCVALNNYFGQSYAQWTGDVGQMLVNSVVWSASNSFSAMSFEGPEGFLDEYAVEEQKVVESAARVNNNSEPATDALGLVARGDTEGIPGSYSLSDAYPNPFNASVRLDLALPESGNVSLTVYNLLGQEIAILIDGNMEAGYHSIKWDASEYSSGIYYYQLTTGNFVQTKRMTLLK